jgi:hypothetical protein
VIIDTVQIMRAIAMTFLWLSKQSYVAVTIMVIMMVVVVVMGILTVMARDRNGALTCNL